MAYIPESTDIIVDSTDRRFVIRDSQDPPHYWKVYVDNSGVLTTEDLGTQ
jgi:hypothetical protein